LKTPRKRKLIGITVAVVAICGGGAAIAATMIGSGNGSSGTVTTAAIGTTTTTPAAGSGGGLGGNLYNGGSGAGRGFGGGGGGGGFRGGGAGGFGRNLGAEATYLGVTTPALQSDLQSGKTLADVAKAQGKSVDGLISVMVDAQKTQFDALVKSGRVTAAQAQQFESAMKQRVTDEVNGTRPSFGGGGFGGGGGGLGGGAGGSGSGNFGGAVPPASPTA
jgi:hypothetical protein